MRYRLLHYHYQLCLLCTLYLFLQVLRNFPCSVRTSLKVVMGRHCGNMNLYINIIKPVTVKTVLIVSIAIYLLIRFSCWFLMSTALPRSDSWAFQSISSFIKFLVLSSKFIKSLLRHWTLLVTFLLSILLNLRPRLMISRNCIHAPLISKWMLM